mmetsp:Transcript_164/g.367  ORF Transcript_164/g.367 Transcript_164/m.367 type:complete len:432 (-) Transcript_164:825-2120(-)
MLEEDAALGPAREGGQVCEHGPAPVGVVGHGVGLDAVAKRDAADAVDERHVAAVEHQIVHVRARAQPRLAEKQREAEAAVLAQHRVPFGELEARDRQRHQHGTAAQARREHHAAHRRHAAVGGAHAVALGHPVKARGAFALHLHRRPGREAAAAAHVLGGQRGGWRVRNVAPRGERGGGRRERGKREFGRVALLTEERVAPLRVPAEVLQARVPEVGAPLAAQHPGQRAAVVLAPCEAGLRITHADDHLVPKRGGKRGHRGQVTGGRGGNALETRVDRRLRCLVVGERYRGVQRVDGLQPQPLRLDDERLGLGARLGGCAERAARDDLAVDFEFDGKRRAGFGAQKEVARLVVPHQPDGEPNRVALHFALWPADRHEFRIVGATRVIDRIAAVRARAAVGGCLRRIPPLEASAQPARQTASQAAGGRLGRA